MNFLHLENFIYVLLFLFMLHCNVLNSSAAASSASQNNSEEIKNIFHGNEFFQSDSKSFLKDILKTENFAEGGSVNIKTETNFTLFPKRTSNTYQYKNMSSNIQNIFGNETMKKQNCSTPICNITITKNKNDISFLHSTVKTFLPKKLNETESDLFLGIPEVVHINGTSSIKPRKGVYCNKIVPRKGVHNENETNHRFSLNHLCLKIGENECYNIEKTYDFNCICCNEDNYLGKLVKQQPIVNCNSCKQVNSVLKQEQYSCQNICCKNNSLEKESYTVTATKVFNEKNANDKNVINTDIEKQNLSETQRDEVKEIKTIPVKEVNAERNSSFTNSTGKVKLKPTITKVPCDVEIVNEILNKTNQEIFVLIAVLIFLLPLIGILILFFWRRMKEYFEKRYYKRMDFLIDGMYND